MATFSSVVKRYRQQGYSRGSAATAGAVDLLKERIDPRRFLFKPDGIMTTLFPGLKPFRAKGAADATDKSLLSTGVGSSPILNDILITSQATAKNTLVLPTMARDMFLVRENIAKLVKLQGGTPRTKAGDWFERQAARENAYEAKFQKMLAKQSGTPSKVKEKESGGFLNTLLKGLGVLDIINQFKNLLPLLGIISNIGVAAIGGLFSVLVPLLIGGAFIAGIVKLVDLIESGFFDKYAETLKNLADKMNEKLGFNKRFEEQQNKNRDMMTHSESTKAFTGPDKDKSLEAFNNAIRLAENPEQRANAITGMQNYRKGVGLEPLKESEIPSSKYQSGAKNGAQRVFSDDIDSDTQKILSTIRERESGGNYNAQAQGSTASGAYQFIDKTWQSLTKKYGIGEEYSKAKDAPPEIQDSVAAKYVQEILKQNGGDVSKVPLVWYTGNAQGNISNSALAANNGLTPEAYQQKWMNDYNRITGKTSGVALASNTPSTGNKVDTTSTNVATQQRTVSSTPVIINAPTTNNNQQVASRGTPPPASPYNEEYLFEQMFNLVAS